MANNNQYLCLEFMQYTKYYSVEKLNQKLAECDFKYAYAIHNKGGEDEHFHVMCNFASKRTLGSLAKFFETELQFINKPTTTGRYTFKTMCEYLIHKHDKSKEQLNISDVISNFDINELLKDKTNETQQEDNENFIDDLYDCFIYKSISYREMAIRYGRDFINHFKNYQSFAILVAQQELDIGVGVEVVDYTTTDKPKDVEKAIAQVNGLDKMEQEHYKQQNIIFSDYGKK